MGTEKCPANMCEHDVDDHYTGLYPGNPIRCKIEGCACGMIKVSQEFWDKIMNKESYLEFRPFDSASGKTVVVVQVFSARHGDRLGVIKWYGRWRQYAFFPQTGTIWNRDCLHEIDSKIYELMLERKK